LHGDVGGRCSYGCRYIIWSRRSGNVDFAISVVLVLWRGIDRPGSAWCYRFRRMLMRLIVIRLFAIAPAPEDVKVDFYLYFLYYFVVGSTVKHRALVMRLHTFSNIFACPGLYLLQPLLFSW